ncbi:Yip1 family protein [Luteimonas sp. A277]
MQPEPQIPAQDHSRSNALIERATAILLSPRSEWPAIAAEPATAASLYTGYFMLLAAIPAVAGFIKGSLIGHSVFGMRITTPFMAGLMGMVLGYVLGLVVLYVVAMIVNALAPKFEGQKNQVQALKAVGYAWTAAWVAGIAVIVPGVGWLLALAGGVYSIYLLYLGLPHTMKCPPEKAAIYTLVSVIAAIVLGWIVGLLIAAVTGMGALAGGMLGSVAGGGGNSSNVTVNPDSRMGQLVEFGRRMEEAGKQMDQARASGSADEQGKALGALMGAVAGSTDADGQVVEAVAADQLRALLPEAIGNMRRTGISASRSGAMGMQISEASAEYAEEDGSGRISVEIQDMAAMSGMMAMAGAFGMDQSHETDSGYERTFTRDGQLVNEEWSSGSNRGKYSVVVGNRFRVEASGRVNSIDDLRNVVGQLERQVATLQ